MENATKALMIAAAVIVAILIISLGIGIFNMSSEQVDNAGNLSEYEIQQFNSKFEKYEGESISATHVNALIDTVFNHNSVQADSTTKVVLVAHGNGGEFVIALNDDGTKSPGKVAMGYTYKVRIEYSRSKKLVQAIMITTNE